MLRRAWSMKCACDCLASLLEAVIALITVLGRRISTPGLKSRYENEELRLGITWRAERTHLGFACDRAELVYNMHLLMPFFFFDYTSYMRQACSLGNITWSDCNGLSARERVVLVS